MNSPSPPPAPDPVATANAQGAMNKETAVAQSRLNMIDEYGPYGSVKYSEIPGSYQQPSQASQSFLGTDEWGNPVNYGGGGGAPSNAAPGMDVPRYQREITLSPEQQKAYDQQFDISSQAMGLGQDTLSRIQQALSQPFSTNGLPSQVSSVTPGQINYNAGQSGYVPGQSYQTSVPSQAYQRSVGADDFSADRRRVEEALFSRLNPQLDRDKSALETRLANMGITRGSEAFDREMDSFGRNVNDARNQVILQGGNEQSRLFGLDLAQGQFANDATSRQFATDLAGGEFGNQARGQQFATDMAGRDFANNANLTNATFNNQAQGQAFGQDTANATMQNAARQRAIEEAAYMRSQPINELAALMGFSPGVQSPQFSPVAQAGIAPPDYMGAVNNKYAADMNAYNQKLASNNSMLGSIFGLGGSMLGGITGGSGFQKMLFG